MTKQVSKLTRALVITNKRGLHARASSKFVKLVDEFDATVTVSKDGLSVHGTSIMGLMLLAAGPGCRIDVTADGIEESTQRIVAGFERFLEVICG